MVIDREGSAEPTPMLGFYVIYIFNNHSYSTSTCSRLLRRQSPNQLLPLSNRKRAFYIIVLVKSDIRHKIFHIFLKNISCKIFVLPLAICRGQSSNCICDTGMVELMSINYSNLQEKNYVGWNGDLIMLCTVI